MRRFALFFGWLVVVGFATTLTWQIVSAADDRVSERPIAPLNVAAPVITSRSTTTTTTSTTTTSTQPSSVSTAAGSTATTNTSATVPSTSAPITTASATWQTRSVRTPGGTLTLRFRPGEVTYQSAAPAPGFQVDVEKPGPPEVRVDFESESQKVEVQASWEDDGLDVSVSTENEGGDDGGDGDDD